MVYCHNCGTKNEDDDKYCCNVENRLKGKGEYDKSVTVMIMDIVKVTSVLGLLIGI
jgi:uncharacterized membrane protein YvbJ